LVLLLTRVESDVRVTDEVFEGDSLLRVELEALIQKLNSFKGEFDSLGNTVASFLNIRSQILFIRTSKRSETRQKFVETAPKRPHISLMVVKFTH
jgi:hypothetical protein